MSRSSLLKNSLPLWNLLFLAVILSGGGFFWHTTHQQQLLDRIDSQLLATAQSVNLFYTTLYGDKSAQTSLCDNLTEFSALSAVTSRISVHSSQGELLCLTEKPTSDENMSLNMKIHPQESMTWTTVTSSHGPLRSLTYPIGQQGDAPLSLVISHNLGGIKKQARTSALTLIYVCLFILGTFAILQRRPKKSNTAAIQKLTNLMDQADTEVNPPPFTATTDVEPEIQDLASSYNNMMTRRADCLRRARQFTADVTHELRTPLTILRGETELALRNGRDPERLRQVLESNLEEISRMSYLIEDLLLLSKGDLGEIPLKMEPLLLNELIIELHHQAQLLATAKNIKVELACPQELIFLKADSFRLRQVFLNLLTNAIKYTPVDGSVSIALSLDEENVITTVTDTGIGMDSEHLEAIFDRFYRIDKTRNRNDGGSGLGLAIVKWIVEAHHGLVKVNSLPGQGSSFTVIFPRDLAAETDHAADT